MARGVYIQDGMSKTSTADLTLTDVRKANRYDYQIAARVYVYDLDTRKEIVMDGSLACSGTGCYAIRNGVRYEGTALNVWVTDFNGKRVGELTAESFPGRRVAVKVWHPNDELTEWRMLVSRSDGWAGNEACYADMPRSTMYAR